MISGLLATKLYRPSPPLKRVERWHLVQQLNDGLAAGRRLTLVSAPAGFGKTTCVSEWLAGAGLPVAWLSLEPADDDPVRFLAYLLAALQGVNEGIGRELAQALQAGQAPSTIPLTTTLANDILAMGSKFVLVLDDFHVIRESAILNTIERLIAGQPGNMHLVLITREDPSLPLARLRANNQITDIRAHALRFSAGEAAHLLNALMELSLSEADVEALATRTEGWVAGLQLAGLSVRGRADASSFIAGLSGSHRYILSYLTEEVLDRQPAGTRDFLLETSILDKLSGGLCEAVTGRAGCDALLERLCAANLFLLPLDDDREWYRYHRLFADLLATRLRQTCPPAEVQALHRRASDWLAENGLVDDAVKHAMAARDYERAVALVERMARSMIFAGRMHTLRNWLAEFPAAIRAAHPRLEVYRTWSDLLEGKVDLGEKGMQEREEMLRALPPSPENDRLRVELTVILCRYSPVFANPSRTIRLAREALRSVPDEDLVTRARLVFALAVAHALEGNFAEATGAFDESLSLARTTGDNALAVEIMGLVARACCHRGQLNEAALLYQAIIDTGTQQGQAPFYPAGAGYIGLAGIYLERYDFDRAETYLARGVELCSLGGVDGIYTAYGVRARLRQARGDFAGALAELDALEKVFPRQDDPDKAARQIAIARAMGDLPGVARYAEPWMKLLAGELTGRAPSRLVLEIVKTIAARTLLAQGQFGRALGLLGEVRETAGPGERFGLLIEVCLLEALALAGQGAASLPAALDSIERALVLAEPEGYIMLFLEEGPAVIPLLAAVAGHAGAPDRIKRYAVRLLEVARAGVAPEGVAVTGTAPSPAAIADHDKAAQRPEEWAPIEPLTERELEILRLIAQGCTNQEIAGRLIVTLHTVKKHSSNIFGKLGVSNRTQAVARARQLGCL